ncbi:MAG TPA: hypothetical protein VF571_06270 [Pyrinomonadaceae bacterium]|jgi:hypothetical protein
MKNIFLLAFIAILSFASAAFGQTRDRVLAQGNPPLTESIVSRVQGVFEWTFNANFDERQSAEFRRILVGYWQQKSQGDMQSVLGYMKVAEMIAQVPNEQADAARAKLQPVIFEAIQKQPNDPMARLLASVYEKSQSANSNSDSFRESATAQFNAPVGNGRHNSSQLIGTWLLRKGSGSGYVNPNTGVTTSGPNATIHSYTFYADGRFEYALMMQSSLYNCTSTINGFEGGTFQDNGDTVDFYTKKATKGFKDTCRPSLNSSDPSEVPAPKRLYYRVARDEYNNLNLCVAGGNRKETCFVKQ